MLRERFTYKSWDGEPVTEDLYFNITEVELGENLHVKEDFEKWLKDVENNGIERELTVPEIQELLRLVKFTLRLAYGVREDDGRRFFKTEEVWNRFTQSASYSPFLMSLFQVEEETGLPKANRWMRDVMPEELREQVTNSPAIQQRPQPQDRLPKQQRPVEVVRLPEPAETVTDAQPDFAKMTPQEFMAWQQNQQQ